MDDFADGSVDQSLRLIARSIGVQADMRQPVPSSGTEHSAKQKHAGRRCTVVEVQCNADESGFMTKPRLQQHPFPQLALTPARCRIQRLFCVCCEFTSDHSWVTLAVPGPDSCPMVTLSPRL